MKKFAILMSVLTLVAAIPAASNAMVLPRFDDPRLGDGSAMPVLEIQVDGQAYNLGGTFKRTAVGYDFDYLGLAAGNGVHLWGAVDFDPSISYAVALTNNTAVDHDFMIVFSTVIVVDNYNFASSSFSASSTDGSDDGVTATPFGGPKMQHSFINGDAVLGDLGVDVGDACVDPAGGAVSAAYTFADVSRTFAPVSASNLGVSFGTTLSGHDVFSANGRTDLLLRGDVPTPEPNSLALLGGGLLTFLASRRRRK